VSFPKDFPDEAPFKSVNRGKPCVICGGDHKCSVGQHGLILCGREKGPKSGFVYLGQARGDDQFALYRREGDPLLSDKEDRRAWRSSRKQKPQAKKEPPSDYQSWAVKAGVYEQLLHATAKSELARVLGVPETTFARIHVGWLGDNVKDPAWTFPEQNGTGQITGILRRFRQEGAEKKTIHGSKRGILVPDGWKEMASRVYLPEGASDVLALLAMGLRCLGRPQKYHGDSVTYLVELLHDLDPDIKIVVLGENDQKDGKWPGKEGAIRTAAELKGRLGRMVYWALPDGGVGFEFEQPKDVRDWCHKAIDFCLMAPEDWLQAGRRFANLLKLHEATDAPGSPDSPYSVEPRGICRVKKTADGEVKILLSNFSAEIKEEIRIDDGGGDVRHFFTISGKLRDEVLPLAQVRSSDFASMNWILDQWGVGAVVAPGQGCKDHLRAAIQLLSGNAVRRTVYAHTGWRKIGEAWCYLHAGGAIGAAMGVEVELGRQLAHYVLPEPPRGAALVDAVRSDVRLLRAASPRLTFPLLGATYRAALGPADFSVNLVGQTGAGKSELAALFQQHYGAAMDRLHLPGNWTSTANALEAQAFLAKDALLVIDDFKPQGSKGEQDQWHAKADRVLRAQGNHSARHRCWADGTLRTERPPRGLILSTGEDSPRGESLRARSPVLHVRKGGGGSLGDIDLKALTPYQRDAAAGLYAQSMSGFLAWLAPGYEAVHARLKAEHAKLRDRALAGRAHARTPGVVADLALGLTYFLTYALEVGAINEVERDELAGAGWATIAEVAAEQEEEILAQDSGRRFMRLLLAVLNSGRGHLAAVDGDEPKQPDTWGWRLEQHGSGEHVTHTWKPQGRRVGWVDGENVYLDPEGSYAEAQRMGDEQGDRLPLTKRQLQKHLKEKGLLASHEGGKTTNRRTVQGREQSVLHLLLQAMDPDGRTKNPCPPTPEESGEPGESGEHPKKHWANGQKEAPHSDSWRRNESGESGEVVASLNGHSPGQDGCPPDSNTQPGGENQHKTQEKGATPPIPPIPPVPGWQDAVWNDSGVI
jgi:hypothetical protein